VEPFLERPLGRFLDDLADASPVPGGGSAAAVATAMAAGLLAMAARASDDSWPEARAVAAQAEALRVRVGPLAELDAETYAEALRLLDERGPGDRGRRDLRLGAALSRAADVPLRIAEVACDVAELGLVVAERGDPERRADATAAVLLADAAARVGAHLVRVNLAAQAGDDRVARADRLSDDTARAALRALGER
jgi:glutamate formiminotransferase/formiminotetrahydrofolate cyclodeaminase